MLTGIGGSHVRATLHATGDLGLTTHEIRRWRWLVLAATALDWIRGP
jgi:hypothetical protein